MRRAVCISPVDASGAPSEATVTFSVLREACSILRARVCRVSRASMVTATDRPPFAGET